MSHTDPRPKDRVVTDEHPGYDARAHYCGEDRYDADTSSLSVGYALGSWGRIRDAELREAERHRPNLRRVRAWAEWAQAAWRIVTLLAVIVLAFAVGVYAESAVWR